MKHILIHLSRAMVFMLAMIVLIILFNGFRSRKLPDLKLWHRLILKSEFTVKQAHPGMIFEEYLALEQRLFDELDARIHQQINPEEYQPYNRYYTESYSFPGNFLRNWNRSFELVPETIAGGVLMLHGLTDSPYSNHALAQVLYERGYYVLGLRFPGHGTIPSALTRTSWEDWQAAARMALIHLRQNIGKHAPLYICGYSTGGSLALKMTFDAVQDHSLEMANKVFLFSPAIAVNPYGMFADWHRLISWIPFFEKIRWTAINPEYDPFKYNSFSKHGGGQVYQLSKKVQQQLALLRKTGEIANLPPIITFQSEVDSTVVRSALIDKLYNKLTPNNHELILFDVNHSPHVEPFIKERYKKLIPQIDDMGPQPYAITVITNIGNQTQDVMARTRPTNARIFEKNVPLNLFWPHQVYSLSHVALLFPEDDPLYGNVDTRAFPKHFKIGTLTPKGEISILNISMDQLMRVRSNPFFDYLAQQVVEKLAGQ